MIIIIIKGRQGRVVGPKRKMNVIERIDVNQRTTQKKNNFRQEKFERIHRN